MCYFFFIEYIRKQRSAGSKHVYEQRYILATVHTKAPQCRNLSYFLHAQVHNPTDYTHLDL